MSEPWTCYECRGEFDENEEAIAVSNGADDFWALCQACANEEPTAMLTPNELRRLADDVAASHRHRVRDCLFLARAVLALIEEAERLYAKRNMSKMDSPVYDIARLLVEER